MLTYLMDKRGSLSLYEYLYRCIREDILRGRLKAGEALPSKRALSKQLQVSLITVENAYDQLATEGYIYSLPRKGYYVENLGNMELLRGEAVQEELPQRSDEKKRRTWFADLASNQTDPDSFPFSIWAKITRKVLAERQSDLMTNSPYNGITQLRESIAAYLSEFRGLNVSEDQIVIGAGTEYLYGQLIQLLGMDRIYGSEDPGYEKPCKVFHAYGVSHRHIPMDHHGVIPAELTGSGAQVIHISPAHHFPTGIIMPVSRRYELLRWLAEDEERLIIEDDFDSEFRLNGRPLPTLFEMDHSERVIYMNTFTKSLASTIRISYMVLPGKLAAAYRKKLGFYTCSVPTFEQYILARFMREGYYERHINRMRSAAKKKRDGILAFWSRSALTQMASFTEEDAGLHFLMTLHAQIAPERFEEELGRQDIHIRSLASYYVQQTPLGKGVYVFNYSSIPDEKIEQVIERIEAAATAAWRNKDE